MEVLGRKNGDLFYRLFSFSVFQRYFGYLNESVRGRKGGGWGRGCVVNALTFYHSFSKHSLYNSSPSSFQKPLLHNFLLPLLPLRPLLPLLPLRLTLVLNPNTTPALLPIPPNQQNPSFIPASNSSDSFIRKIGYSVEWVVVRGWFGGRVEERKRSGEGGRYTK